MAGKMSRFTIAVLALTTIAAFMAAKQKVQLPLDPRLIAAQYVYVENQSGDVRTSDSVYKELLRWGRFKVVNSREKADIILLISSATETTGAVYSGESKTGPQGGGNPSPVTRESGSMSVTRHRSISITVVDRVTENVLWYDGQGGAGWSEGHRLLKNFEKRLSEKK